MNKVLQKKSINKPRLLINSAFFQNDKDYKSSQFVIPFLLSIYNAEQSKLTLAVSQTIVSLDDLAQEVDSKLDSPNNYGKSVSTNAFVDLELKILECFSPLAEIFTIKDLFNDTLKFVNISFELNVLKRSEVYSLQDCNAFLGCTMFYAFPLVKFLNEVYSPHSDIRTAYCLLSNFIQIVDDFVDLFEDLSDGILTPVTSRYSSYQIQNIANPFVAVQKDVQKFLMTSLDELNIEINQLSKKSKNCFLEELETFVENFNKIDLPENNRDQQEKYLLEMIDITPPILCYTGS